MAIENGPDLSQMNVLVVQLANLLTNEGLVPTADRLITTANVDLMNDVIEVYLTYIMEHQPVEEA
jgi:hypothetical protein